MLCLGINQACQAAWTQLCGETNLGLYYTGLQGKKIGVCSNMKNCNWQSFRHTLVYETQVNGKTFKAKVDTDQNIEFTGI